MSHRVAAIQTIIQNMEKRMEGRTHTHPRALLSEMKALSQSAQALNSMYSNPDPYQTPANNDKRVAQASAKLRQRVESGLDKLNDILRTGVIDLEDRIAARTGLKPGAHDAEIRQVFRSVRPEDRLNFINNAPEAADAATLSAILTAPHVLTGIDQDIQSRYLQHYQTKKAPEEVAEREMLNETLNAAWTVRDTARKLSDELLDPAKLREAEKQEELANQAKATFESSLSVA